MSDKLILEAGIDETPFVKAMERIEAAATNVDKAMSVLGKAGTADFRAAVAQMSTATATAMQEVRRQLATISTSVKGMQEKLGEDAKVAGQAVGSGMAKGVEDGSSKVMAAVRRHTQQTKLAVKGHYDALGMFISDESAALKAKADASSAGALLLDTGAVRSATTQVKATVKGHYDALGMFISEESAALKLKADASAARALTLDTGSVRAATVQATGVLKGHYDALGMFISEESATLKAKADASAARVLMLDTGAVRAATVQATGVVKGHYDALGMFISEESAALKVKADTSAARALMLDTGAVRAATVQATGVVKGHYDALGMFISEASATLSAKADASAARALMLDTGAVRAATVQATGSVKGHYDALGMFISEESAALKVKADASAARALMLDTGAVRAATAQAKGVLKGHYDALGFFVSEEAGKLNAKFAAAAQAATDRATQIRLNQAMQAGLTPTVGSYSSIEPGSIGTVRGIDGVSEALKRQTSHANELHSAYRGLASGFGAMWLTWGAVLPLLGGAALSHGFVQAVKAGAEFEHTLTTIQHLAEITSADLKTLSDEALRIGSTTQFGPLEVAKALKSLALAGLDARQQMEALQPVLNFSTVSELPLEKAAESLVAISTAFGYSANGFGAVGDLIAKAASISMSSVSDMTEAFRQASTISQLFGVSVRDAATSLALMSQVGIRGSAAGTALRNMYTELLGMTKGARKILNDVLGVQVFDNAAKAMKPLPIILKDISTSLADKTFEAQITILQKLGNERGLKALAADLTAFVTAAKGAGKDVSTEFERISAAMEDAPGFMAAAAVGMSLTALNQIKAAGNALQTALVKAFESASPAIQQASADMRNMLNSGEFLQAVRTIVSGVAELISFFTKHIDVLAAVAAGFVIAKVALLAMSLAVSAASVVLPALGAALGAVGIGSGAAAVGVRGFMAALGPVGLALALVGAAYAFFGGSAKSANAEVAAAETARLGASLQGWKDEEARLLKQIELRERGGEAATLAQAVEGNMMVAGIVLSNDRARAANREAHAKLLAAKAGIEGSEYGNTAQGAKAIAQLESQLADSRNRIADGVLADLASENSAREQVRRTINAARADAVSAAREVEANRKARPAGPGTYDPDAKDTKSHLDTLTVTHTNELAEIEKQGAATLALLNKRAALERATLTAALESKAIDQGTYAVRELALTQQTEFARRVMIESTTAEAIAVAQKEQEAWAASTLAGVTARRGTKNEVERNASAWKNYAEAVANANRSLVTYVDKQEDLSTTSKDTALARVAKQASDAAGELRKLKLAASDFWTSEANLRRKENDQAAAEDALRYASPQAAAYISAAAKETERLTGVLEKHTFKLEEELLTQTALNRAMEDQAAAAAEVGLQWVASAEAESMLKGQNAIVQELTANLNRLKDAIPGSADRAGQAAVTKYWKDWQAGFTKDLTGVVMTSLFQGGKAGSKSLRALLASELKKPIQVAVQAMITPFVQSITGAAMNGLGLGGTSPTSSVLSTLGSAGSFLSGGSTVAGWLGGSTGFLGSAVTAAGNTALASTIGITTAEAAAGAAAAGAAGGSAAGAAVGVAMMEALAPLLAAAPYLAALAAVYLIAKSLDNSGTPHTGGGSQYSSTGGLKTTKNSVFDGGFTGIGISDGTVTMTSGLVQGIVGILDSTAVAFGKQAGYTAAASFADDSSKDGSWGSLVITKLGTVVTDWASTQTSRWAPRVFSDGADGSKEYLAAVSADVRSALDAIGLPSWATKMLDNLGSTPSLEELAAVVSSINKSGAALAAMGRNLVGFSDLTDEAVSRLIEVSGSIDTVSANAGTYYDNFYPASEKARRTTEQLTTVLGALGFKLPKTREGFRELVESQQKLGASGMAAVSVLWGVAGAFAGIVEAGEDLQDFVALNKTLMEKMDVARGKLVSSYKQETDALKATQSKFSDFAKSLRTFRDSLLTGSSSPLTPLQRYEAAQSKFRATTLAAKAGDETALGELPGAAQTLLDASQAFNSSGAAFTSDFNMVRQALTDTANSASATASVAQLQIDALKSNYGWLEKVDGSLKTFSETLADYTTALTARERANGVQGLYERLLGRPADQDELEYWWSRLSVGLSPEGLEDGIRASPGHAGNPSYDELHSTVKSASELASESMVNSLYGLVLGRSPDDVGGAYWASRMDSGTTAAEVAAEMLKSAEYTSLHGTHALGLASVPFDGYRAELHKGERVLTARDNNIFTSGQYNAALVAEMRAMREEMQALREQNNAGHMMGAQATERNTAQVSATVQDSASKGTHAAKLERKASIV